MTIDRLEELHTLTGQFSKIAVDAGYDSTAVDFATDVRSLIDAEIERRSVRDGEVERAINLMEWCKVDVWMNHPIASEEEIADAVSRYDLAIDALRAYRKPEPCEWCKDLPSDCTADIYGKHRYFGLVKHECPVSYCSNCGRKIEVEL